MEDTLLVDALRRGEAPAFETLVRNHGPRLLEMTRRLLRHDDDAARAAVQDAFVLAFDAIEGFDGVELAAWLHDLARSAALLRLPRPLAEEPIDALLPAFLDDGHHVRHPHAWSAPAEAGAPVRDAVDRLPDAFRIVLLLHDGEGLGVSAVARALGLTDNLVKLRLHRARQALRGLLEAHFGREN